MMRRAIVAIAVLLLASSAALAQEAATEAGGAAPNLAVTTPPTASIDVSSAIEEGVRFLIEHQNADGSFGHHTVGRPWEIMADVPGSHHAFKTATTALCWMGLRNQPSRTPEMEEAASRALGYLVKHARVKRPNGTELYNVWAFGYGLRALAEALESGAPGADPEEIRRVAQSLVDALEIYQVPDGGWGYYDFLAQTYNPSYTSMSFTTATILIALHRAREAGIDVPDSLLEPAIKSVRRCRKTDGSYLYGLYLQYQPNMGVNRPKGSSMRTPACNLALHLFNGGIDEDDLRAGVEMLLEHHRFAIAGVRRPIPHESWYQVSGYFYLYGHQYAALCLELLPEQEQSRLWPPLVQAILKTRQNDGSFWDYPLYGYHKFYGTGYALMALARCPASTTPTGESTREAMEVESLETLRDSVGSTIVVSGTARSAKLNAVLVTDEFVLDIPGLESWPPGIAGKAVKVKGTLQEDHVKVETVNGKGLLVAAPSPGLRWVLRDASWKLVQQHRPSHRGGEAPSPSRQP